MANVVYHDYSHTFANMSNMCTKETSSRETLYLDLDAMSLTHVCIMSQVMDGERRLSRVTRKAIHTLKQIPGQKIVTWTTMTTNGIWKMGNFDMVGREITTTSIHTLDSLWTPALGVTMVVRQFTSKVHAPSGLPVKHVRGYLCTSNSINKLGKRDFRECFETDVTGHPLPPEPGVVYV